MEITWPESGIVTLFKTALYSGMDMSEMTTKFRIIMVLMSLLLLSTVSAYAEGNLDPAFGVKGAAVTDFGIADDEAMALTVQPDGKILLAGFSDTSVLKDIAVARYLQDGKLDTTFHGTGFTTFNVGSGNAMARAMAVQDDGKIVIAGTADNGANEASSEIFLVRLSDAGEPDLSFGAQGRLVLPLQGRTGIAYDLQLTADGDILVAGTAGGSEGLQAMVARVDQQGRLDGTFGDKGTVLIDRDYETAAHSLVVLSDNSILFAGYSKQEEVAGLSLFRLKTDGTVDESFGAGGEVRGAVQEGEAIVYDMVAQADGRVVIAGSFDNGKYREVLLGRFLANGQADTSFGTAGLVRNDLGQDSVVYAVAVQQDGGILATGFSEMGNGKDVILLRYGAEEEAMQELTTASPATAGVDQLANALTTDQSQTPLDDSATPAESAGGITTATFIADAVSAFDDEGRALAILPNGAVLAGGFTSNGADNDFLLLQFSPNAVSSLDDSSSGSETSGVPSTDFRITTTPITNITRNSAMSGGVITTRSPIVDCEESCLDECEDDDSDTITSTTACFTACLTRCTDAVQTITARGVVFGTAPHPVFRPTTSSTNGSTNGSTDGSVDDSGDTPDDSDPVVPILPTVSDDNSHNFDTVLFGQTSDGTGIGSFGSHIINITPDTLYFVRAYAVLSDDRVIYGNELSFETKDACFIATAAYGSLLDPHVVVLRNFRDSYLKGSSLGQAFINGYYRFSPAIAEVIEHNEVLKQVVRLFLWPWVAFCYLMLHFAGLVKFAMMLLAVLFAGVAAYFLKTNIKSRKTV